MSIARALTKRARRHQDPVPSRGGNYRFPAGGIDRNLISLPTELISTTNVHALTAPDIRSISTSSSASSGSSINSAQDSDFLTSPGATTDASSVTSSPITPASSDARGFFDMISKRSAAAGSGSSSDMPTFETPAIPQRALSHSKKAHVELSRERSLHRMSPPPTELTKPTSGRNSADIFKSPLDPDHPFGKELAQVNEVAEGFGGTSNLLDEEEQELLNKGLKKFDVNDYLDEIAGLYGGVFEGHLGSLARPWI